jgi:DNA-binding LacI/PurR family transcriptional regulator
VGVVGYDDILLAAHCVPPLTTVRQDIERIGGLLVETLMRNLEIGVIANVTMPADLVVRQSSGPVD